jgi:hypothetical protein
MKMSEFYIGQEITADLGKIGPSVLKVVAIDSKGFRLKLQHYTNKETVFNKDGIEHIMMRKFV